MVPLPKLFAWIDDVVKLLFYLFALDSGVLGGVGIYLSFHLTEYILISDLNPGKLPKREVPMKIYPLVLPPLVCVMAQGEIYVKKRPLGVSSEVEEGEVCHDVRELGVLSYELEFLLSNLGN